jgi:hypothetical protein
MCMAVWEDGMAHLHSGIPSIFILEVAAQATS